VILEVMFMATVPFNLLVETNAGVQLFLHVPEHILSGIALSLSHLLKSLNPIVLL
jgi:hypothetical protein